MAQILKKSGLTDQESKVYVAGLKSGPFLVSQLSKQIGISRQYLYSVLGSLEKKGLVTNTGSQYNQRFIVERPIQIKNLLERKKREIEKIENQIDLLDVELKAFEKMEHFHPNILFSDDLEGLKNIWEKCLNSHDKEILSIIPVSDAQEALGREFIEYFVDKRIKLGKFSKTLRVKSKEVSDDWYKKHKEQMREVKYLPEDTVIGSTIIIYDDSVSVISSKRENFAFSLTSKEFSSTMKGLFQALWEKAEL